MVHEGKNDTLAEIIDKVNAILAQQLELGDKKLTADMKLFEELGMDSLDAIDMAIACKKNFNVDLKEEEMRQIRTLGDVYQMVQKYHDKSGS